MATIISIELKELTKELFNTNDVFRSSFIGTLEAYLTEDRQGLVFETPDVITELAKHLFVIVGDKWPKLISKLIQSGYNLTTEDMRTISMYGLLKDPEDYEVYKECFLNYINHKFENKNIIAEIIIFTAHPIFFRYLLEKPRLSRLISELIEQQEYKITQKDLENIDALAPHVDDYIDNKEEFIREYYSFYIKCFLNYIRNNPEDTLPIAEKISRNNSEEFSKILDSIDFKLARLLQTIPAVTPEEVTQFKNYQLVSHQCKIIAHLFDYSDKEKNRDGFDGWKIKPVIPYAQQMSQVFEEMLPKAINDQDYLQISNIIKTLSMLKQNKLYPDTRGKLKRALEEKIPHSPLMIPVECSGHLIGVLVLDDILVCSNAGFSKRSFKDAFYMDFYKINDQDGISEWLSKLIYPDETHGTKEFESKIEQHEKLTRITSLKVMPQLGGSCPWKVFENNFRALFILLAAKEQMRTRGMWNRAFSQVCAYLGITRFNPEKATILRQEYGPTDILFSKLYNHYISSFLFNLLEQPNTLSLLLQKQFDAKDLLAHAYREVSEYYNRNPENLLIRLNEYESKRRQFLDATEIKEEIKISTSSSASNYSTITLLYDKMNSTVSRLTSRVSSFIPPIVWHTNQNGEGHNTDQDGTEQLHESQSDNRVLLQTNRKAVIVP